MYEAARDLPLADVPEVCVSDTSWYSSQGREQDTDLTANGRGSERLTVASFNHPLHRSLAKPSLFESV